MSDEREKKLGKANDDELEDVEAHKKANASDEPAEDEEPDFEAHRNMGRSRLER